MEEEEKLVKVIRKVPYKSVSNSTSFKALKEIYFNHRCGHTCAGSDRPEGGKRKEKKFPGGIPPSTPPPPPVHTYGCGPLQLYYHNLNYILQINSFVFQVCQIWLDIDYVDLDMTSKQSFWNICH